MHMIGPHMGGQQTPTSVHTYLPQCMQHYRPAVPVEQIRHLIHALPFIGDALRVSFQQSAPGHIVAPIYRTRFIAVQVPAVSCERDEVPHSLVQINSYTPLPYGRGSESRGSLHRLSQAHLVPSHSRELRSLAVAARYTGSPKHSLLNLFYPPPCYLV